MVLDTPPVDARLQSRLEAVLGNRSDPIAMVSHRARRTLTDLDAMVWEADAASFQFLFVNSSAFEMFGYRLKRWTSEPRFWIDTVVHPEDRREALACCALATAQGRDHRFAYRAVCADGSIRWVLDVIQVITGQLGVAERLRGIMIDISDEAAGWSG